MSLVPAMSGPSDCGYRFLTDSKKPIISYEELYNPIRLGVSQSCLSQTVGHA